MLCAYTTENINQYEVCWFSCCNCIELM